MKRVRVTGWPDEVQARVDSKVALLSTLGLLLLPHVHFVLIIEEVNDGGPRVPVVDVVAEAGRVNDGELDFEDFFFELGLDDLNLFMVRESLGGVSTHVLTLAYLGKLVKLLDVSAAVVLQRG